MKTRDPENTPEFVRHPGVAGERPGAAGGRAKFPPEKGEASRFPSRAALLDPGTGGEDTKEPEICDAHSVGTGADPGQP